MATESDVVVGSKWRFKSGVWEVTRVHEHQAHMRCLEPVDGQYSALGMTGTWFLADAKAFDNVTRIDQPPEKAGEDVPVGSRWRWDGIDGLLVRGDVVIVQSDGATMCERTGELVWPTRDHLTDGTMLFTRLDTPQEAAPTERMAVAGERFEWLMKTPGFFETGDIAVIVRPVPMTTGLFDIRNERTGKVAAVPFMNPHASPACWRFVGVAAPLQQGGVTSEKNMRSLINSFRKGEGLKEVCLTSCGPATPCLASDMCRARDERERRAHKNTLKADRELRDMKAGRVPHVRYVPEYSYRYAPPEPNPVGYGALTGVYRVSVERHKRAR